MFKLQAATTTLTKNKIYAPMTKTATTNTMYAICRPLHVITVLLALLTLLRLLRLLTIDKE